MFSNEEIVMLRRVDRRQSGRRRSEIIGFSLGFVIMLTVTGYYFHQESEISALKQELRIVSDVGRKVLAEQERRARLVDKIPYLVSMRDSSNMGTTD